MEELMVRADLGRASASKKGVLALESAILRGKCLAPDPSLATEQGFGVRLFREVNISSVISTTTHHSEHNESLVTL